MVAQSTKKAYRKIMEELGYDSGQIDRIEDCKTYGDIMHVLENARIQSIDYDMERKSWLYALKNAAKEGIA